MPDVASTIAGSVIGLQDFLNAGGNVLIVIMGATFIMWSLIIERLVYFAVAHGGVARKARKAWDARADKSSEWAIAVRDKLLSDVRLETTRALGMIKVFVAIAPLLGLLGTVTGMIEVFDVIASVGSSNARLLAGGITKATIPTMAGLVASLSGVVLSNYLDSRSKSAVTKVGDQLIVEA